MIKKTKILFTLLSDSYGGTERRFTRYFDYSRNNNDEVYLFINTDLFYKIQNAGLISNNDNIFVCPKIFSRLYPKKIKKYCRLLFLIKKLDLVFSSIILIFVTLKIKPKLIHAVLGGVYAVFPILLCGFIRICITMPSIDLSKLTGEKLGVFINLLALKMCYRVDVLSPTAVPEILEHGIKNEKIFVSECSFTDYEKFKPGIKEKLVVFAARLESYHRAKMFLYAVKLTGRKEERFAVIGSGCEENELRQYNNRELNDQKVEIFFKDDISDILAEALIFVSLKDENYPSQSLLEAMASGCSIIAVNRGDTNRLVNGEFGFLIDLDAQSLAEKIVFLLDRPEIAVEMGEKARMFIIKNHNIVIFDSYMKRLWGFQ